MDAIKRGQMGEADAHTIRRKIEEKQILIREHRKVRERLSRECADTLLHIAATKSNISQTKAQHEGMLKVQAEDFSYSTAGEKREILHREEKRAELERMVASSDVVEREHRVLMRRLVALRMDDEKEELANAREMDALKRNLFNVRNELENVFRTTLHNLNVAYQSQAFDAMVEEATKARGELPSLRRDLCIKTRHVNHVMAKQCRSSKGAGHARAERDMAKDFVKLQVRRVEEIRQALVNQRDVASREKAEIRDLGTKLETFQAEAGELRLAVAILQQLKEESSRKRMECLHWRQWAHTLARKGPKAIKSELKRQRLVFLTAAARASFKTGGGDSMNANATNWAELSVNGNTSDDTEESKKQKKVDPTRLIYIDRYRDHRERPTDKSPVDSGSNYFDDDDQDTNQKGHRIDSHQFRDHLTSTRTTPTEVSPRRRETLILVSGMVVDGLGVEASQESRLPLAKLEIDRHISYNVPTSIHRGQRQASIITREKSKCSDEDTPHGSRSPSLNPSDVSKLSRQRVDKIERIWRASLFKRNKDMRAGENLHDVHKMKGMLSTLQYGRWSSAWVKPSLAINGVDRVTCRAKVGDTKLQEAMVALASESPTRLDKLPAEIIASMLLSDHKFDSVKGSESMKEKAQQWENSDMVGGHHPPSHQFPDLPYGFTDLGRRVNVENVPRKGRP